jgi:tRNA(Ile)-lysidine synthase
VSVADSAAVTAAEAQALFVDLTSAPVLILAISGGPDSTALLALAARWRAALAQGPKLIAVTIDHGLRPEAAGEAGAVKKLSQSLGIRHRILRWTGKQPTSGLQEAARNVRYRLLCATARGVGATHILTAHTLDDQAETVLIRMARGSGLAGLGAMTRATMLEDVVLLRPLLDTPKARLLATLDDMGLPFADDPSNCDPRFTRARLRAMMPTFASEGLDARRLAQLARRLRRADEALEAAVAQAAVAIAGATWSDRGPIVLDAIRFMDLPAEIALRLLGHAITRTGDEGPVELAKLEALYEVLREAHETSALGTNKLGMSAQGKKAHTVKNPRLRRTLAGAMITLAQDQLLVEQAPPRTSDRSADRDNAR